MASMAEVEKRKLLAGRPAGVLFGTVTVVVSSVLRPAAP